MNQVRIVRGEYHSKPVAGTFTMTKPYQSGKRGGFVTILNDGTLGNEPVAGKACRVMVNTSADFEYLSGASVTVPQNISTFVTAPAPEVEPEITETETEAMDRIATRFAILDEMSGAAINGDIRGLIVSGPPGIGKSFGVEQQLEKATLFDELAGRKIRFEFVKGATTALGLYAQLYKYSDEKNVLVFDDCDSVLMDDLALNILKAALDSGKRRKIFWNSDSALLRREGIPDCFDFKGSVIFITNLKFHNLKSKKLQDHLEALQSRCHFLDLTVDTERDKMLRIKQVHRDADGGLFADYYFENDEANQVLDFMWENKGKLRELSLRMCLKIADLIKISPNNWKNLAKNTVMHRG
jgi:hypothetical protein